jgi:LmbE family N-acetylglucosaminyl deacetylase
LARPVLLALCAAACGDNLLPDGVPLAPAADLVVVAHQDDDLLFMQPDVLDAVRGGAGITSVYVTAGNGTKGTDRADRRYEGLMEAYGAATNATEWSCGFIELVDRTAQHCRLADRNVTLVFLGYPDGGKEGELDGSLLSLWEGTTQTVETVAERTARYDRAGLIDVVAQIVRETQPLRVRTLEVAATHGRDHSDHMLVGALTVLALSRANSHPELISYRGYATASEPPNKHDAIFDDTVAILGRYEACAADCGSCGDTCTTIDQTHITWLRRRYAVGFRDGGAGRLRNGTQCLHLDATLASCDTAPVWRHDAAGQLRSGTQCLAVGPGGGVAIGTCIGGVDRRFLIDDEGHIWSGVAPEPEPDMDYGHLRCLSPDGTSGVRATLCRAPDVARWELAPPTVENPRADLMLAATGRELRVGDLTGDGKADLCAVEPGLGFMCAPGDGTGAFAAALRIDHPGFPLDIDPRSLALGDVDGDGRVDACGRDGSGILCSTSGDGFVSTRWTPSFNDAVARPTTSASITAIDANADGVADICGVDMTGVVCAPRGFTLQPVVRSPWPEPAAVVWPADLDGDRMADWCTATDLGPACAVEAQRDLTTDGAPWGFAQGGVVEIAPATSTTVSVADIDGDGRADLCSLRDDRITCARSQGRAFGPRTTLAILPAQSVASALWLGDLDGDGRADPCADTGTTIVCAVAPSAP